MFPDLRETRGPGTGGPGHASNGTARRRAAANGFLFCRSAKALDHIGVAEPVKPAAHGPKGPGRRV